MTMIRATRFYAVVLFCFFAFEIHATNVVVVKDLAKVLLLPYGDAKMLGLVKKGESFKVVTKKNDWFNIEYKNSIGWIFQDNVRTDVQAVVLAPLPSPASPTQPLPQTQSSKPPQSTVEQPKNSTDITAEKIESRLLKKPNFSQSVKPKKSQSFSVDLPLPHTIQEKLSSNKNETQKGKQGSLQVQSGNSGEIRQITDAPVRQNIEAKSLDQGKSNLNSQYSGSQTIKDSFSSLLKPENTGDEVKKFFEVDDTIINVYSEDKSTSPILGFAKKGECFVLMKSENDWCQIRFGNAEAWIEASSGKALDNPSFANNLPRVFTIIGLAIGLIVVIILFFVLATVLKRSKSSRRISIKKDLLLIAHTEKEIQYSLTNDTTSLSKCFSEIGFKVNFASDMDHAKNLLMHYLPDVIVIDWQLGNHILQSVESVLANRTSTTNILVVFYNVPDASTTSKSTVIPNVAYLGISFSDRDVFKLVTPLIITESETKSIRKSVESSALGGDIGAGSLIEVMQFIEIGGKTGCLFIIEEEKPYGLIYFEQGRLTYAASQGKQGRDAVFEILGLKIGKFHFVKDKTTSTKNISVSTLEILMEWTKAVDEAHRL